MKIKSSTLSIIIVSVLAICLTASCDPQKRLARKEHRYMKATYKHLKKSLNECEVYLLRDTVKVIFPNNLLFKVNSSEIPKSSDMLLERFSRSLNKYDKTNMLITGHSDTTGNEDYNVKLSQARAESTKKVLIGDSVKETRMFTWGLGSSTPITSNRTEEGRERNRRVEFIILFNSPKNKLNPLP